MNRDLKNGNFDKYRIYIYLMYNALNKGIFKSYSKYNLYRGGTLSNEEFNNLMEYYENKKDNENIFFFSRKFLSFSKTKEVANRYLKKAIKRKYAGIYVRFKIEGISGKHFFFSNIDIEEISEYKNEKEVLFLPLSCFEVVNIKDEIFYDNKIKVIHLRYLYQYKNEINKFYQKLIENQEESEENIKNFLTKAINSKYSKEMEKCFDTLINKRLVIITSKNSFTKKLLKYCAKKLIEIGIDNIFDYLGNKVSLAIISYFCFQSIPAFIISNLSMIVFGYIKTKIIKKFQPKEKSLEFKCISLFNGYLPEKCKKELFPEFIWYISGYNEKSFAIELIVDDNIENPSWLILGIPSSINEILNYDFDNKNKLETLTIVKYKGIPDNSFSAYILLYVLDKENISLDEFKDMKKDIYENKKKPKFLLDSRLISLI